MTPINNGHKANHYKCQARKLKKEMRISHHEALDKAVQADGYSNWKHFTNGGEAAAVVVVAKPIPSPATISYQLFPMRKPFRRPNVRMPIAAHQAVGKLLKEVYAASYYRKSVTTPVGIVRNDLDNWVQKEYTNHDELPNDVFFDMYYRGEHPEPERMLSDALHVRLVNNLREVQQLLGQHYHQCAPLAEMQKRLDTAIAALDRWHAREGRSVSLAKMQRVIKPGTLVWLKTLRCYARAYQVRSSWDSRIGYYGKGGFYTVADFEVSVPREQSIPENLTPMRLYLPYGKWLCADGTEVLYNRDYCPIWARTSDGKVFTLDPDTWIANIQSSVSHYFADRNTPWNSEETHKKCVAALKEWGVHNRRPRVVEMFDDIVKNGGDFELLKKKSSEKKFPVAA